VQQVPNLGGCKRQGGVFLHATSAWRAHLGRGEPVRVGGGRHTARTRKAGVQAQNIPSRAKVGRAMHRWMTEGGRGSEPDQKLPVYEGDAGGHGWLTRRVGIDGG